MPDERDALRDWLRRGDPADDAGLTATDRAVLRSRILSAARSGAPAPPPRWRRLVPVALAAGLLLAVGVSLPGRERFRPADPAPSYRLAEDGTPPFFGEPTAFGRLRPPADLAPRWSLAPAGEAAAADRRIEFTTPGGHRVVWNLDRELRLPERPGGGGSPDTRS